MPSFSTFGSVLAASYKLPLLREAEARLVACERLINKSDSEQDCDRAGIHLLDAEVSLKAAKRIILDNKLFGFQKIAEHSERAWQEMARALARHLTRCND